MGKTIKDNAYNAAKYGSSKKTKTTRKAKLEPYNRKSSKSYLNEYSW